MITWEPSKENFDFARDLTWTRNLAGLNYCFKIEGRDLIIGFKETNGDADDWAINFEFFPLAFDIFPGSKIKAHEGFAKKYLSVRKEIMGLLYSGDFDNIYVGGFSQGGSISQLCVQDIGFHIDRDKEEYKHLANVKVMGISYDGARPFCTTQGSKIKKAVKGRLFTIKNYWDPVTWMPLRIMPTFFSFRWKPLEIRLRVPTISFWRDYGKIIHIGKLWRVLPIQHEPEQMKRNLLERFGK